MAGGQGSSSWQKCEASRVSLADVHVSTVSGHNHWYGRDPSSRGKVSESARLAGCIGLLCRQRSVRAKTGEVLGSTAGDQGQGRASKKCLGGSTEGRAGLGYTKKQTMGWGQLFSQLHPEKVAWGYNSPISPDGTAIRRSESPRGAFHAPWRWAFAVLGDLGFTLRHQCHNANRLKAAIRRVTPNPVIQWSPQQLSFGWRKREVQSKNGEKFFPWKTPVWVETFPTLDSPQKKARNGTAT